jgi:phosphatidylglycerophosphate synthase
MFTTQEIDTAKHYKYNGTDDSICAKLFLRPFWNWAIEFVPRTIAPNTITLIAFLFEVVAFVFSFVLTNQLTTPLPRWACAFNGIALFIYQTLDNLDGRQARRTNSSSALGQFFDHGCDALTGVFTLVQIAATLGLGNTLITFWLVMGLGFAFVLTVYEEYVTHAFYLGLINGPEEGLLSLIAMHLAVAVWPGARAYLASNPIYVGFAVMVAFTTISILLRVVKASIGDRAAQKRAVIGFLPVLISLALFVGAVIVRPSNAASPYFTMAAGFLLQYLAQLVLIAHLVGRRPTRLLTDPAAVILWIAALGSFIGTKTDLTQFWYLYYWAVLAAILVFDVRVVLGFTRGLEIPAFSLLHRPIDRQIENVRIDPEEIEEIETVGIDRDDEAGDA